MLKFPFPVFTCFVRIKMVQILRLINHHFTELSSHFFGIAISIFHKTEIQTVILWCWTGLYLNWFYSYGIKRKRKLIKILWLRCLTIWKDEFIWRIKMGYKAFRKVEKNWFCRRYLKNPPLYYSSKQPKNVLNHKYIAINLI